MALTLPIEIGKKYIRRDGKVVTAREPNERFVNFRSIVYVGDDEVSNTNGIEHCWRDTGLVSQSSSEYPMDLVADYTESHIHANSMLEYAKDAMIMKKPWLNWEVKSIDFPDWKSLPHHPSWAEESIYRRKSKTVLINGVEVSRGISTKLNEGDTCYISDPGSPVLAHEFKWEDTVDFNFWYKHGLVHRTKKEAVAMAEAMLNF